MNKFNFLKNYVFVPSVGPSETGKSKLFCYWLKNVTFQPNFDKIYLFYQHSQLLFDVMQKKIENLGFFQVVHFDIIELLKSNGTKYLVIFVDSCEEICTSKAFVDFATAGRHRGLSSIYIQHNLFHQSELGRYVEPENTHIVPFKSPCDVASQYN